MIEEREKNPNFKVILQSLNSRPIPYEARYPTSEFSIWAKPATKDYFLNKNTNVHSFYIFLDNILDLSYIMIRFFSSANVCGISPLIPELSKYLPR